MPSFYVRQVVTQTLVYLVDVAENESDAVRQVKGGQVPIAFEENGDITSVSVSLVKSDAIETPDSPNETAE